MYNIPKRFQVQDNCHILESSLQQQGATRALIHTLLDPGWYQKPTCKILNNIKIATERSTIESDVFDERRTFEPDLFGLFTMLSSLCLEKSNARFKNSLFCSRVSILLMEISLSFTSWGYESCGFFSPCTGAMNKTCKCNIHVNSFIVQLVRIVKQLILYNEKSTINLIYFNETTNTV